MIKNYFKVAWRHILQNRSTAFINLFGLTVAMAGVILIGAWVQNEVSFEKFHENRNELYKVWNRSSDGGGINSWDVTSGPVAGALKKDYPEIKNTSRIYWATDRLFSYGDKIIKAKGNEVDKPFLTMFTFPLLRGDRQHALDDVQNIVLTEGLARNLFGDEDPINKVVKIDNKDIFKVTGVLRKLPGNTEFNFDYLMPLTEENARSYGGEYWATNTFYTYVQLWPHTDIQTFNEKIKNEISRHYPQSETEIFLHPLEKWHLYSRFENGKIAGGRIEVVRLLILIGCLILLIACINFMNLSTAQSERRAKEVGIRKVVGAGRYGLIMQFLFESILLSAFAAIFSLMLVQITLPYFNELIEKSLVIDYSSPLLWISIITFVLITGILAGSYPAFFLSSFKPSGILKGMRNSKIHLFNPRKILVVMQFTVAIILIVSTVVIYKQIQYVQKRNTGYNLNNLVEIPVEGDIRKNFDVIKNELLQSGVVTSVGRTSLSVTVDGSTTTAYEWEGMDKNAALEFSRFGSGGDFVKTLGLNLSDGRDLDLATYPADSSSVLLNETAVKKMGLKHPVGQLIRNGDEKLQVVGVFKDFIIGSPYENIKPMMVLGTKYWIYNVIFRLNPQQSIPSGLAKVEKIFRKYNPSYPFTYHFVDEEYGQKFNDEVQTGKLSGLFAGLTILISCLGLFGLAAYMAENRSKEIGIRKVLGASVTTVVKLLSKEFVALVAIAIVIAIPVSWLLMNKWLQGYTYRINIGWTVFLMAAVLSILIALLTVSYQAIKAAVANPVRSLRTE